MAGVVGEQRINTDDMLTGQMIVNDLIREQQQQTVPALAAFHPLLVTKADFPFVAAGRRVPCLAAVFFLPADRVDIGAATEKSPEKRDLLLGAEIRAGPRWCSRWRRKRWLDGMSNAMFFQQGNQTGIFATQLGAFLMLVGKLLVE